MEIHRYSSSSRTGFTLVELSIVLVILGLLVGGVLSGQSLIRAAELRAVTSEQTRYVTAVNAFRDKYFALPGDMTNAASFWTGTSNGNGDGTLTAAATAGTTGEMFQFWNQLSLAGLIEGTYSGLAGSGAPYHCISGTNVPKSKLGGATWAIQYIGVYAGDSYVYTADYGNALLLGALVPNAFPNNPVLRPEDNWNIDKKIDDGMPGTGKVMVRETGTWSGAAATKCTTSTATNDYAGTYNLSNTNITCQLYFVKPF